MKAEDRELINLRTGPCQSPVAYIGQVIASFSRALVKSAQNNKEDDAFARIESMDTSKCDCSFESVAP